MTETMKAKINKRIEKYVELGYIGRLTQSWDCDNFQTRMDGSLTATLTRTCKTDSGLHTVREKILIPKDGRKNVEWVKDL
jgi:hypothetical protein